VLTRSKQDTLVVVLEAEIAVSQMLGRLRRELSARRLRFPGSGLENVEEVVGKFEDMDRVVVGLRERLNRELLLPELGEVYEEGVRVKLWVLALPPDCGLGVWVTP